MDIYIYIYIHKIEREILPVIVCNNYTRIDVGIEEEAILLAR